MDSFYFCLKSLQCSKGKAAVKGRSEVKGDANYNVIFRKSIYPKCYDTNKSSKMRHVLWKFDLEEKVRGHISAYTAGNNVLNS